MLKETLRSIILSQQEWLVAEEKEITREQLGSMLSLPSFAYILTGVRRAGKSTLLKQLMREHKSRSYFNFEDSRTAGFEVSDFQTLEELFEELFGKSKYLFFDEIQNVQSWERYVRDAVDRRKTVVITGSNANLLSRELGTKLTGRHLDFEVFPFSYNEFLSYFRIKAGAGSFAEYIARGGFPGFLNTGKDEMLSSLATDILMRDIFGRYNLRNHDNYRKIVQFLLSNTGKEVSFNNLKNVFEIGSASSVMDFFHYLTDAYLIFIIPIYNASLKVQARNPRKVYAIDQGLVKFSSVSASPDNGRLLENTVFLHLRRTENEIWYYKGKRECDFICRSKAKGFSAFQVSWQVEPHNEKREVEGLFEAMQLLKLKEGKILTFNQQDKIISNGKIIYLIPAWKWMTGRVE